MFESYFFYQIEQNSMQKMFVNLIEWNGFSKTLLKNFTALRLALNSQKVILERTSRKSFFGAYMTVVFSQGQKYEVSTVIDLQN